jgi:DNA uptake protein ComE-like DNA-binding protein
LQLFPFPAENAYIAFSLTAFIILKILMDSFKNFFRNWFGYSRQERRSTFILLNIILIILSLRYIVPYQNIVVRETPLDLPYKITDSIMAISETRVMNTQKRESRNYQKRPVIDLNGCDSASLEALPGIGPVLSSRIIRYRKLIGGFASVDQLREVYGLPEETFNMISPRLRADSLDVRKISINKADYRELIRHPYFKKNEAASILKYRELKGSITNIGVMIENNLISPETMKKIRPYLDFGE